MSTSVSERKSRISGDKENRVSGEAEEDLTAQTGGPDIAIIKFSPEDEDLLRIRKGEHITIDRPWKTVSKSTVVEVLEGMGKVKLVKRLKTYDYKEVLIGFQATLTPTEGHLVCLTDKGRERVLGELGHLHSTLAEKVRQYLNRSTQRPPQPKWIAPPIKKERPPITYEWVGQIEARVGKVRFGTVKMAPFYSRILCRNKESIKLVESAIQHAEVLATPRLKDAIVQTEPEISINDCTQFVPEVDLPSFTKLTSQQENKLAQICRYYKDTVMEATGYNSLFDLYKDDYSELLDIGTPLAISIPGNYSHYMSFNDISQFEGKILTALSWHPEIPGGFAVAYGNLSANHLVRLESDSEDENYHSRGEELEIWAKTRKVNTVEDKVTNERDAWSRTVKRLEHLVNLEYSEDQWAASEVTLDAIEAAMRLRDFEVHAQKLKEDLIPFYDAGPDEYDMYYVPYGADVVVDQSLMKTVIAVPPEEQ